LPRLLNTGCLTSPRPDAPRRTAHFAGRLAPPANAPDLSIERDVVRRRATPQASLHP
jgi:hypothetical protein